MNVAPKDTKITPFLKWAGGKRWLVGQHPELFPIASQHFIEPFCGSSAVFFYLRPSTATLSDTNVRLIECYLTIRDDLDAFLHHLDTFSSSHSPEFYYNVRQQTLPTSAERAAQFLYLNRVCFNGIYRENLSGTFNVPLGTKQNVTLKSDNFPAISQALQSVDIRHCDFEQSIDAATCTDFLYVDPPYVTKHNINGFAKYNQQIFSWTDQERLAESVMRAHLRGVSIVVSNADHPDVHALYSPHLTILSFSRYTVIASKSEHRVPTTEMVATNVI